MVEETGQGVGSRESGQRESSDSSSQSMTSGLDSVDILPYTTSPVSSSRSTSLRRTIVSDGSGAVSPTPPSRPARIRHRCDPDPRVSILVRVSDFGKTRDRLWYPPTVSGQYTSCLLFCVGTLDTQRRELQPYGLYRNDPHPPFGSSVGVGWTGVSPCV